MARLYKSTILAAFILSLALSGLSGCTIRSDAVTVETAKAASPDVSPPPDNASPATERPAPETSVPTPTPSAEPEYPDVTEQAKADDTFFSDAAFLGNSLVDGFRLFSGLTTCDYYAATSMTVTGAGKLIDQMGEKQYAKVYILLGINEIGYDVDYFKGLYGDMLDSVRKKQPNADIYLMSLTPVSASKSASSETFNMTRVKLYNDSLYALAKEKGCWYLDLCTALSGSDGFLPGDVTSDGVHFAAEHYKVWLEYLRTHYNPTGTNKN